MMPALLGAEAAVVPTVTTSYPTTSTCCSPWGGGTQVLPSSRGQPPCVQPLHLHGFAGAAAPGLPLGTS